MSGLINYKQTLHRVFTIKEDKSDHSLSTHINPNSLYHKMQLLILLSSHEVEDELYPNHYDVGLSNFVRSFK